MLRLFFLKNFAVSLLCIISTSVLGQLSWDSTYRPDIYRSRVQMFQAMPSGKKDIVFAGDSITFWGDWTERLGTKKVKNRGIPGDTSFGLLEHLEKLLKAKPDKLFIMIGVNDLARHIPVSVLLENYRRMIQVSNSLSPGTDVYFQTILPVNSSFKKLENHYAAAIKIEQVNDSLRSWASGNNIRLIDLSASFSDAKRNLKEDLTWDGVHLTADGYQLWVTVLKSKKVL